MEGVESERIEEGVACQWQLESWPGAQKGASRSSRSSIHLYKPGPACRVIHRTKRWTEDSAITTPRVVGSTPGRKQLQGSSV